MGGDADSQFRRWRPHPQGTYPDLLLQWHAQRPVGRPGGAVGCRTPRRRAPAGRAGSGAHLLQLLQRKGDLRTTLLMPLPEQFLWPISATSAGLVSAVAQTRMVAAAFGGAIGGDRASPVGAGPSCRGKTWAIPPFPMATI